MKTLPEKWAVKTTNAKEEKVVREYFNEKFNAGANEAEANKVWYWHSPRGKCAHFRTSIDAGYTEISFSDFERLVLGRGIVGYRLVKPRYKGAVNYIVYGCMPNDGILTSGSIIDMIQEAGVLDLWFEPMYEETPKFKVGDWVIGRDNYYPKSAKKIEIIEEYLCRYDNLSNSCLLSHVRPATTPEIKAALLAEARRRYPVGTKYIDVTGQARVSEFDPRFFGSGVEKIEVSGFGLVYFKGKWASIISTPDQEIQQKIDKLERKLEKLKKKL